MMMSRTDCPFILSRALSDPMREEYPAARIIEEISINYLWTKFWQRAEQLR